MLIVVPYLYLIFPFQHSQNYLMMNMLKCWQVFYHYRILHRLSILSNLIVHFDTRYLLLLLLLNYFYLLILLLLLHLYSPIHIAYILLDYYAVQIKGTCSYLEFPVPVWLAFCSWIYHSNCVISIYSYYSP